MICGPLFSLRVWGVICPCCESSENRSARLSLQQLNRLGRRISWHTAKKRNLGTSTSGFMQNIFVRSSNDGSDCNSQSNSTIHIPSQLKVKDAVKDSINNGEPYPELQICPRKAEIGSIDNDEPLQQNSAMSFQLDIPLHHIQRIDSIDTTVVAIYTKDIHANDEKKAASEKGPARISFASSHDRNVASLDLQVLIEWNKQRQPEIEEELPSTGIRQRAKKAAHFAKREIEMREKKREREKRKAGHMQNISGGLKYTAIAMANQGVV